MASTKQVDKNELLTSRCLCNRMTDLPNSEHTCFSLFDLLFLSKRAGEKILSAGETALDAVIAAVKVMESTKWFNAGKGSVCTKTGEVEMDASVMEGHTLRAGACAGVRYSEYILNYHSFCDTTPTA